MELGSMTMLARIQAFFTALPLGFGLLHLILFAFLPKQRSNLYYALFLLLFAATVFFDFQEAMAQDEVNRLLYLRLHRAMSSISFVFALQFFCELFLGKRSRQFWVLAAGLVVTGILAVVEPIGNHWMVQLVAVITFIEIMRLTLQAIGRGAYGAWIIGAGFLIFALFATYDLLLDFGLMSAVGGVENAYQFGMVGLFIATSMYLARNIARTSEQLVEQERRAQEQELEHRLLEAEFVRKTKELEEARSLQLSMLPRELPTLPGLNIAVHMQTATEVGGDYYDFHHAADDSLTIAIGDATGHGLRAGIMVAIAKSLFKSGASETDFPRFFDRCTRILKQMKLRNLFMAMALVRIEAGRLIASSAGMPPILVYRACAGAAVELVMKGMPLGAFPGFQYERAEVELGAGDTVLLMSDGFPEMFNIDKEMLGWAKVKELFEEAGERSPEEIIAYLCEEGGKWRGEHPVEDDITFVVVQISAAIKE